MKRIYASLANVRGSRQSPDEDLATAYICSKLEVYKACAAHKRMCATAEPTVRRHDIGHQHLPSSATCRGGGAPAYKLVASGDSTVGNHARRAGCDLEQHG